MKSWWTDQVRRGTVHHAVRATRTSGGRGVVNCWARKSVRFYAPGSPRKRFRPPPTGCSAWRHDIYILPESTVLNGAAMILESSDGVRDGECLQVFRRAILS